MAKKSKEQRQASRKEGWKTFREGVKQYATNAPTKTKEVGYRKGVTGNYRESQTGEQRWNQWEGVKKMAKGLIKGIFNNPSWWSKYGSKPRVAINDLRPMDPGSLSKFNKNVAGMGVGNVVDVFFQWKDISNTENFKLVTQEAFKDVREQLRSNLPYTQETFRSYLLASLAVSMMLESLSKSVGWYNFTRSEIPGLNKAMALSGDAAAFGISSPKRIVAVQEENIARTLVREEVLQRVAKNLVLPKTLQEIVHWLFGTTFCDQSAPNFQMYRTWCVSIPVYNFTENAKGDLVAYVDKYVDGRDLTVDFVIDYITQLVDVFGIPNADISKTNNGAYVPLHYTVKSEYKTDLIYDYEFFNMIINGYSIDLGALKAKHPALSDIRTDFFRVDFMPEMKSDNEPGALQGIGAILATNNNSPLSIVSQSVLLNVDTANVATAYGIAGAGNTKAPTPINSDFIVDDFISVTINSDGISTDLVNTAFTNIGSNSVLYKSNFNNPNAVSRPAAQSFNITWLFDLILNNDLMLYVTGPSNTINVFYLIASRGIPGGSNISGLTTANFWLAFYIDGQGRIIPRVYFGRNTLNPSTSLPYVDFDPVTTPDFVLFNTLPNGDRVYATYDYVTLTSTGTATGASYFPGDAVVFTQNTSAAAALSNVITHQTFAIGGASDNDLRAASRVTYTATYTYTSADGSGTVSQGADVDNRLVPFFIENVDYHIPVFYGHNTHVYYYSTSVGDAVLYKFTNDVQLLKECYIPTIYSVTEAETLLYAMWASALRISNPKTK